MSDETPSRPIPDTARKIEEAAEQARVLMADATAMLAEIRGSKWWAILTMKG